ncbi:hypothetical protein QAD02_007317 [Eretmocerus hayati]|uniref:Uncharacterized protein n=1 Tax=Eretmocerus hayati TaxID=131215 RepID=A0ACC2N7N1_9HYME|nr:hypothetical protein QAD02_007317 [Eretmocerus hayati]
MERFDSHVAPNRKEIERVVTRCIHIRDNHMKQLKKNLKNTQKKCEVAISKLGDVPLSENVKFAISISCGKSGHHSSTEPYFLETAYNTDRFKRWVETDLDGNCPGSCQMEHSSDLGEKDKMETILFPQVNDQKLVDSPSESWIESVDDVFIMNDRGQVTNILPPIPRRGKLDGFWVRDDYCRAVDVDALQEMKNLYYEVIGMSHKNMDEFISDLDVCAVKTRAADKKGHPVTCYAEPLSCKSKFLKLDLLSYHFPNLRTMRRSLHRIKNSYDSIIDIGNALKEGNFSRLSKIYQDGKNIFVRSKANNEEVCLDEDKLHETYSNGIQIFKEIDMDPPRIPCISCERLCTSKYTSPVAKHLDPTISECLLLGDGVQELAESSYWKQLQSLYDPEEFNNSSICNHCSGHLKKNRLPSLCILNNLRADGVPEEIKTLNRFEKMLIQRAKAFQCIVKLGTVQKKNIPHHMKLDQVKGTFHSPLPLEATLNKLCKDTDPIDVNHELFVLIRSNPTKKKVIWEDYVNLIKKIWTALKWFKVNNPLYKNIHLPGTPDELLDHLAEVDLEYPQDLGNQSSIKENASDLVTHCCARDVNGEGQGSDSRLPNVGRIEKSKDAGGTPDNVEDHPNPAYNTQLNGAGAQVGRGDDLGDNVGGEFSFITIVIIQEIRISLLWVSHLVIVDAEVAMSAPDLLCFFYNGEFTHRGNSAKINNKGIHTLCTASENRNDPILTRSRTKPVLLNRSMSNFTKTVEVPTLIRVNVRHRRINNLDLAVIPNRFREKMRNLYGMRYLYRRLTSSSNLLVVKARYHEECYALYCQRPTTQPPEEKVSVTDWYGNVTMRVWEDQRNAINNGEIFYPSELREIFTQHVILNSSNSDEANDMRVEMTGIRDGEGDCGIVGFTLRADAVIGWILTRNVVGEYARDKNLRSGLDTDDTYNSVHEQNLPSPLKRDEKDVLAVMEHISHNVTNPFDVIDRKPYLSNLILSVPVTDIPLPSFKEDGSKRTATKSDLLHMIEKKVEENTVKDLDFVSQPACIMADIMTDIQSLNTEYMASFDDIGKYFVNAIGKLLQRYVEVHLIFDRYDDSINPKDLERSERYWKLIYIPTLFDLEHSHFYIIIECGH